MEGRKLKDMFGSQAKSKAEGGRNTMSPAGPVTQTTSQPTAGAPARRAKTLEVKEVDLFYGDFQAVYGVNRPS